MRTTRPLTTRMRIDDERRTFSHWSDRGARRGTPMSGSESSRQAVFPMIRARTIEARHWLRRYLRRFRGARVGCEHDRLVPADLSASDRFDVVSHCLQPSAHQPEELRLEAQTVAHLIVAEARPVRCGLRVRRGGERV